MYDDLFYIYSTISLFLIIIMILLFILYDDFLGYIFFFSEKTLWVYGQGCNYLFHDPGTFEVSFILFIKVQFGICLFHADESSPGAFVARPYNFFVFPPAGIS